MTRSDITKNLNTHLDFYNYNRIEREKYTKKFYDRRLSKSDKKKIESKFAFRKKPITIKHVLIMIIIFVTIMFLLGLNTEHIDKTVLGSFIFLFFLLAIAMGYDVNSKFYIIFIILFILVIFFASYTNYSYKNLDELKSKVKDLGLNNKKFNKK